jgi:hypothetical protein
MPTYHDICIEIIHNKNSGSNFAFTEFIVYNYFTMIILMYDVGISVFILIYLTTVP